MTFTAKTRQAKRKLETKEDKNTASESSGKTIDIVSDDRDLTQELNDALLEEVKNNEKAIANLERKEKKHLEDIKQLKLKLEKSKQTNKDFANAGSQTTSNDIRFCIKCEYPAKDLYEYFEHE